MIKRASAELAPTDRFSTLSCLNASLYALGFELCIQHRNISKDKEPLIDMTDKLGVCFMDNQLSVLRPIAKRSCPTHPQTFAS